MELIGLTPARGESGHPQFSGIMPDLMRAPSPLKLGSLYVLQPVVEHLLG